MATAEDFDLWIRKLSAGNASKSGAADAPRARVICFPHAGGSANFYFQFARGFGELDVYGVQYPGRQDRRHEPFRDSIEELADDIADVLGDWDDLPVILLGNSMGALVAFEVAHRLEARGRAPLALFACGRVAPMLLKDQQTHLKGDDAFIEEMALLGGMAPDFLRDKEMLDLFLPSMRADYRLAETYACPPEMRISAPIHVHIGRSDPKVIQDEAAQWALSTSGEFTFEVHEGGHFFFTDNGDRLTAAITKSAERACELG
ncbi:alpha/beta fold hydrolase [Streptomyces sp. BG9H]|uniref:Alpha/beta fold hydrolase n=1 Tax=Streptomyces anatolicus TaxID=2675858 RepID=A0ABS6YNP3_9ACTN|nr:alpha/beta fold hydrolase [Streptomyces anatolicus]MBW5422664.1 alpha/beta fold hydrolase [Streptomyces anatolicus]